MGKTEDLDRVRTISKLKMYDLLTRAMKTDIMRSSHITELRPSQVSVLHNEIWTVELGLNARVADALTRKP